MAFPNRRMNKREQAPPERRETTAEHHQVLRGPPRHAESLEAAQRPYDPCLIPVRGTQPDRRGELLERGRKHPTAFTCPVREYVPQSEGGRSDQRQPDGLDVLALGVEPTLASNLGPKADHSERVGWPHAAAAASAASASCR
jgi:hypothetical protein